MTKCRLNESQRAEMLLSQMPGNPPGAGALAHVAECASCALALRQYAAVWEALDGWSVPDVSSGFNRELYSKIDAELSMPWYERWAGAMKGVFTQPSFALGIAGMLLIAGFALDHPMQVAPQFRSMHPTSIRVSTTEAEQVERTLEDMEMLRQFDLGKEDKESASKSM